MLRLGLVPLGLSPGGVHIALARAAALVCPCMVLLLGGCATLSPPAPTESRPAATAPEHYRSSAPYNRPYRVRGRRYYPLRTAEGYRERGVASWYGWESGNRTAMGTRFDPRGMTAAHRTLPLPSRARVTNLRNGKSVIVVVNDRGPFHPRRIIDLSRAAARAIGIRGLGQVEVVGLGSAHGSPRVSRQNTPPALTQAD